MEKCYDIVLRYNNLSEINKKTLNCLLERLEQAQLEEREFYTKDLGEDAEDSHM